MDTGETLRTFLLWVRFPLRRPNLCVSGGTGIHSWSRANRVVAPSIAGSTPVSRTKLYAGDGIGRRVRLKIWILRVRVPRGVPNIGVRCYRWHNCLQNSKIEFEPLHPCQFNQRSTSLRRKYAILLFKTKTEDLSHQMRRVRVILEQNKKCLMCNYGEWLGKQIMFELDHIDGDRKNNSRNNLRALCPNCHSTTPTWRGKKKACNFN